MDANEVNKAAGAVLGMLTLAMGIGFFSSALVAPKPVLKAGYALPDAGSGDHGGGGGAAPAAAVQAEPIAKRLASAEAPKGEASAKSKCSSCHQFVKDGKNGTGPALYGIVTRAKGSGAGFNYSAAMKGKGGNWTYEDLDAFLANPKGFVPNTTMGYAGVPRPDERANIVAYLRTLAETPAPLPQP